MAINIIYLTTAKQEQDIEKSGFDLTFVTASETFVKMWVCKLLQ